MTPTDFCGRNKLYKSRGIITNIHEDSSVGMTPMGIRSTGRKGCTINTCLQQIPYGGIWDHLCGDLQIVDLLSHCQILRKFKILLKS
jgi:hypothetical protein